MELEDTFEAMGGEIRDRRRVVPASDGITVR
jgi:hypothetical protein